MSGYSEQSQRLARELAEKAAKNLRRSGRTVERDAETGRYTVGPRGGGETVVRDRNGRLSHKSGVVSPTSSRIPD